MTRYQDVLSETYVTWDRTFGDHHLILMGGHSFDYEQNRGLYTTARGFVNDVLRNEDMNASDPALRQIYNDGYYVSKLLSFYGRANYSLKDRYLFTLTMRADGSTKFGKNNKWGFFPSQRAQVEGELRHIRQPGHQLLPDPRPLRQREVLPRRKVDDRHRPRL